MSGVKEAIMQNDYRLFIEEGGKCFVLMSHMCRISRADILELLASCGIDEGSVVFIEPDSIHELEGLDGAPVVVPLDANCFDDETLETAGDMCSDRASVVVAIAAPSTPSGQLHPIGEDSGQQVSWNATSLTACLSGSRDVSPEDGTGKPVPRKTATPVKC